MNTKRIVCLYRWIWFFLIIGSRESKVVLACLLALMALLGGFLYNFSSIFNNLDNFSEKCYITSVFGIEKVESIFNRIHCVSA